MHCIVGFIIYYDKFHYWIEKHLYLVIANKILTNKIKSNA
jgi:hypothetical protein